MSYLSLIRLYFVFLFFTSLGLKVLISKIHFFLVNLGLKGPLVDKFMINKLL